MTALGRHAPRWWPPCFSHHATERFRELHPDVLPSVASWDLARGETLAPELVQSLFQRVGEPSSGGEVYVWGEDRLGIHVVRPMREVRGKRFTTWVVVTYIRLQESQRKILEG